MNKAQVAQVLDEIGTLLELHGENRFRSQAYHNAARAVAQLEGDLAQMVAEGRIAEVKGIGTAMEEKIAALVTTGQLAQHQELLAQTPAGLLPMLRIPGLGPKKIQALWDQLHIESVDQLHQACLAGTVAALKGFGAKTQAKILQGIEFLNQTGARILYPQALRLGQRVLEAIAGHPQVIRAELCGSLRRRRETIGDLDLLVSSAAAAPIMDAFVGLPDVVEVLAHGPSKSSVLLAGRVQCDLRVVTDAQFPFALHYFTGSKEHNIAMRQRAQEFGLKLNEYELAGEKKPVSCRDEADLFSALGLEFIPPELREDTGEIEAAAAHRLPELITQADLRGCFHCHTTWSDGAASTAEMARAARLRGMKYLGIADHSQSLTVAHGLTPERVRQQLAEIDRLKVPGIRLFKGTECDILADGRLDFDDATLEQFDYVVASVHSHFGMGRAAMTARIIRAMEHPRVTMLGHPTGRLLLARDAYELDLGAIIDAAARTGTMIEINAHPNRLDLDWLPCKRAKERGVTLVINPDAHATGGLDDLQFGVNVARRGWLTPADVLNTRTAAEAAKMIRAKWSAH